MDGFKEITITDLYIIALKDLDCDGKHEGSLTKILSIMPTYLAGWNSSLQNLGMDK